MSAYLVTTSAKDCSENTTYTVEKEQRLNLSCLRQESLGKKPRRREADQRKKCVSNFMAIILARLNCRIYPKFRRVFSFFRQHLRSKRELVIEDSNKMFKISRGKFLLTETITSNS